MLPLLPNQIYNRQHFFFIFEADNVLLKNSFTLRSAVKIQRKSVYLLYIYAIILVA